MAGVSENSNVVSNDATNGSERMVEGVPLTQTINAEQACHNLSYLWTQARHKEHRVTYLKAEIESQAKFPLYQQADFKKIKMEQATEEKEYQAILGEIALFTCPIENCKIHTFKPDYQTPKNLTNKNVNSNENNDKDKSKIKNSAKNKRPDNEEFQLPRKAARIIKEIPISQGVCTTKDNFAVLEDEQPAADMRIL
ncbi:hypothetical protein TNCT_53021 [Trichonephila clavata]|uniref:Uncharacterized protein n=1 Tax=Trichonephila clavata TaxID=2740835 RepID=A0A8X6M4C6_TRICU|nr:hypothetical protein TNCT_53021 [Trichonephila clavata]